MIFQEWQNSMDWCPLSYNQGVGEREDLRGVGYVKLD